MQGTDSPEPDLRPTTALANLLYTYAHLVELTLECGLPKDYDLLRHRTEEVKDMALQWITSDFAS